MTSLHDGRAFIVTGAGRRKGIGFATAICLAREGGRVLAVDVDESALAGLAATAGAEGLDIETSVVDVRKQADVDGIVSHAIERHGAIDAVANVAGVMDHFQPVHEIEDEVWQRVFDVNVTGTMRMCRAVLPHMLERGKGVVVNVASFASLRAGASGSAYTASKHAVAGLTRSMAFMYARKGVRCNAVLPGAVSTEMPVDPVNEYGWEAVESTIESAPLAITAEEMAEVISWVASERSSCLNGSMVLADGGWAA